MPPRIFKCAFAGRFLLLLAMVECNTAVVTAAALNGEKLFTYTQPNGETFKVRLWGDEFFAYQETEDGYLVVRDPRKGFFCYAQVLPDGSDIVSTDVNVGHPKPAGLMPKQRLAKLGTLAPSPTKGKLEL